MFQIEQNLNGVGIARKEAETARIRLLRAGILVENYKPITLGDNVYFPISDSSPLSVILPDIPFSLKEMEFPPKLRPKSLKDQVDESNLNLNDRISLKYDQIGEIAVTKLDVANTDLIQRKKIGDLILNCSPKIKSVLNKIDNVDGQERIYPIEHLAGKEIYETWYQEYGVRIFVDIKNAYFNPRLTEEHKRLARLVKPNEIILDLFTGVGPFALHCTKEQLCQVIAVDINPYAINALTKSIKVNHLQGAIYPIIGDSTTIFRSRKFFDRIILNIPQVAITYLGYAAELVKKGGVITFYQFMPKSENPLSDIQDLISKQLSHLKSYKELRIKMGREVSPSRVQINVDLSIE